MKYIFVWPYGWFDSYMYRDLFVTKKVVPFPLNKPSHSKIINFIRRVHRSHKVNKIIHLPFQDIWAKGLFDQLEDNTCVIFDTGALSMIEKETLYKIKGSYRNIKMALFIADSLHGSSLHIPDAMDNILTFPWDVRLSYDKNDCQEFGFQYLGPNIYSKMTDVKPNVNNSELYFIGRNKAGRNEKVLNFYERCIIENILTNFYLIDNPRNIRKNHLHNQKGLIFDCRDIPYEEVISEVLATNCILEFVAKGQKAQTARYYEAVCYNKKLLTNNPSVKDLQFYDPRYIQYFETIDDIDFAWIKKKEKVDYHYNGEFSPIHALEKLEKILTSQEK